MCWAQVRMNVKGPKNESVQCSMRISTQSPNMWKVESKISVSGTDVCTQKGSHIPSPPPALLQILGRPAFSLQSIIKTQSWRLVSRGIWLIRAQSACYQMPGGYQVRSVNPGDKLQLQLPAAASPVWLFKWGQWPQPHPVVAPSCKIGSHCFAANHVVDCILSLSLNPKPVNQQQETH